jgi:beta-xylosidase
MKFASTIAVASALGNALAQQTSYTNPVLWYDLADLDVFRKDTQYYYSASTMSFSPGAPILRSGDLVNWEFVGHSLARLDFHDAAYDLVDGKQAYVRGVWASSMQYREVDDMFYWIGCVDQKTTYIYKAKDVAAEWTKVGEIGTCYYDCGLLFDNRDIYVAVSGYSACLPYPITQLIKTTPSKQ